MPTSRNKPSPTEQTRSDGSFVPPLPCAADRIAAAPRLGTFLIESRTGRVLAMDAQAAEQFSIYPGDTVSGDTVSGDAKPDATKAHALHNLFPELSKQEWISLLEHNGQQERFLSTLVRRSDGSKLPANLSFLALTGPQEDLVLLSVEPPTTATTTVLHRDALTGLPDRRELVEFYQHWQQTTGVQPNPFALLFMDLDDFKQINDQYGHTVGDQVLTILAQRWHDSVRDGDIVVRYGGDEFVILLAGLTDREEVEPVIARLNRVTADPVLAGNEQLVVGITIGVTLSDKTSTHLEQLIHAADRDMYASKRLK